MKKIFSAFVVVSLLLITTSSAFGVVDVNRECMGVFNDVKSDDPLCPYVEYIYAQGITGAKDYYNPGDSITRGQFATLVVKTFGLTYSGSVEDFPDVPTSHSFYEYIRILRGLKIINGYTDGLYRPENPVSRAAALQFIVRASWIKNSNIFQDNDINITEVFPDVPEDHTFAEYITRVYASTNDPDMVEPIVQGYSDGLFRPDFDVTRAQTAKMLTNTMKYAGFDFLSCDEYFCQDKFQSDGSIRGEYFDLDYDSDFWNVEINEGSEIWDNAGFDITSIEEDLGLPEGTEVPVQYITIGSLSTTEESGISLMAVDFEYIEEEFGMTFEEIYALMYPGLSGTEGLGSYFVESIEDGSLILIDASTVTVGTTVEPPAMATNGFYRMALTFRDVVGSTDNTDLYGFLDVKVTGNVMYMNLGLTEDRTKIDEIVVALDNVVTH